MVISAKLLKLFKIVNKSSLRPKSPYLFCGILQKVVAFFALLVYNVVRGDLDETIRD